MRIRTIKKYGDDFVIKLEQSDINDFGLVEGDKVDIDDLNLLVEEKKWTLKKIILTHRKQESQR